MNQCGLGDYTTESKRDRGAPGHAAGPFIAHHELIMARPVVSRPVSLPGLFTLEKRSNGLDLRVYGLEVWGLSLGGGIGQEIQLRTRSGDIKGERSIQSLFHNSNHHLHSTNIGVTNMRRRRRRLYPLLN